MVWEAGRHGSCVGAGRLWQITRGTCRTVSWLFLPPGVCADGAWDALCVDLDHFGVETFGGVWCFIATCCGDNMSGAQIEEKGRVQK